MSEHFQTNQNLLETLLNAYGFRVNKVHRLVSFYIEHKSTNIARCGKPILFSQKYKTFGQYWSTLYLLALFLMRKSYLGPLISSSFFYIQCKAI